MVKKKSACGRQLSHFELKVMCLSMCLIVATPLWSRAGIPPLILKSDTLPLQAEGPPPAGGKEIGLLW